MNCRATYCGATRPGSAPLPAPGTVILLPSLGVGFRSMDMDVNRTKTMNIGMNAVTQRILCVMLSDRTDGRTQRHPVVLGYKSESKRRRFTHSTLRHCIVLQARALPAPPSAAGRPPPWSTATPTSSTRPGAGRRWPGSPAVRDTLIQVGRTAELLQSGELQWSKEIMRT